MADTAPYSWIDRTPTDYFDPVLNESVRGIRLRVVWTATGTPLTVYLPLTSYTPDQVDAAIKAAGAKEDAIAGLAPKAT